MSGLFDALQIGGNALTAQQAGAQIVGANIANANVEGYHREDVAMMSGAAYTGVERARAVRAQNTTLEQTLGAQLGQAAYSEQRASDLTDVQNIVGDMSESGLSATLGRFYASWRTLSAYPEDLSVRSDVLANAQRLVSRTQQMAIGVSAGRFAADSQVVSLIADANSDIEAVAHLNGQITALESAEGSVAADLRDERDRRIGALAQSLGTKTLTDANGEANVTLGGVSLVSSTSSYGLTTVPDTDAIHHVQVLGTTQGNIDSRITSGKLGALLAQRDTTMVEHGTSLDQFAFDLTTAVNAIHKVGFGLDGLTGRDMFVQPTLVSGAAAALALDPTVSGQPMALATATTATTLPRDNAIAVQMGALEGQHVAATGTQTLGQSVSIMLGAIGRELVQAQSDKQLGEYKLEQVQNLWQQQNGVSLQEQMLQLTRYQSAYQASVKLISTIDTMLGSLLRL